MKILAINCKPDLSYYIKKGLNIEVEYKTINEIFPLRFLYNVKNQSGVLVPVFTPWAEQYLEANYKDFKYSAILVGYKPSDYSNDLKNTGGYTHHTALSSGTRWATIRQDVIPNNNYALHEMMHVLTGIINIDFAYHYPIDYMDTDKFGRPYYQNDFPDLPTSNYAQTWANVLLFLDRLNAIKYNEIPKVTLTRLWDWGQQTVGRIDYGTFYVNTLERGWKNNQQNISSIPKGEYMCKWRYSWKFGWCYEVTNVPNRTAILLHEGNYFFDSLGCIILGKGYGNLNGDKLPDLLNSAKTRKEFETLMGKKDFILVIK